MLLLFLERRRPLRSRTESQASRLAINVGSGLVAATSVALTESPLVRRLAQQVESRGRGLVPRLKLPQPAADLLTLVFMDYTLYLWHIMLHKIPVLWKWHRFHHVDADLDVSTALRFHAAELLWSMPWRAAQVVLIGVSPRLLSFWGKLTLAEVMFHHSNVCLTPAVDRLVRIVVVTPAMHGEHHSVAVDQGQVNLSSGLSVWDRLHGTWREPVQPQKVTIGLPDDGRREERSEALGAENVPGGTGLAAG